MGEDDAARTKEQVADEEALRAFRAANPKLQERWKSDDPSKWHGLKWGDGRVRELDLKYCPLKELPAQVGRLNGLTTLNLSHCPLKELPAELGGLTALTALCLNSCPLTELPAELGLLTGLTTLNLSRCPLKELPAQVGRLTGLDFLNLGGCGQLMALPAEIGLLVTLATLDLEGCNQLTELPAEIGQLVNLTTLNLRGCDQLALPPGVPANAKETSKSAPPIAAAYAPLLIVERNKDTPGRLHAFLLAAPVLVVQAFFKSILTDAAHADWLGEAVKAAPDLARLADPDGRRAIDVAVPACKQQMEAALMLLGHFEVDDGPLLHRSATSAVAAAADHAKPEDKPVPRVALKAMQGVEQVRAELQGRAEGLKPEHVVAVKAVYADQQAVNEADSGVWQQVQAAAAELEIEMKIIHGLSNAIELHLFSTKLQESDESVATESGKQKQKPQTTRAVSPQYKYLVVMDCADRSLKQTIDHEHIAGKDFYSVRAIAADLARALDHLHSMGFIQADHKPNNAVAFGGDWRLIDLDVACKIGEPFGSKVPSSGYCPPEMARVLLKATNDKGTVNGAKLAEYVASEGYDLWSFGTVLYQLIFGRPLWLTDVNDNVKLADLRKLAAARDAPLRRALDDALYDGETFNAKPDLRTATDLLRKLLEPNEETRKANFPKGMKDVQEHVFFQNKTLDSAALGDMNAKLDKAAADRAKMIATQEKMMTKLDLLTDMSEEHRTELLISRRVLKKAIFEATEVLTPTTFVILDKELEKEPPKLSPEQSKLLEMALKEDGAGFEDISGDLVAKLLDVSGVTVTEHDIKVVKDTVNKAKERFDNGVKWVERLQTFGKGVIEGDADTVFGQIKKALGDLVTGKTMYFYLVDELTGKPVRGPGYPIKITKPKEIVHKLLPVMQVGMRAMSLFNGVAGIAQMFYPMVPTVPKKWREGAQASVELLKQESSVEKFGTVHEVVKADQYGKDKTTRGASLRELQRLFEDYDKEKTYAGLRRIAADDGAAVWTALINENEVAAQLDKRAGERREEERRAVQDRDAELERLKKENEELKKEAKHAPATATASAPVPSPASAPEPAPVPLETGNILTLKGKLWKCSRLGFFQERYFEVVHHDAADSAPARAELRYLSKTGKTIAWGDVTEVRCVDPAGLVVVRSSGTEMHLRATDAAQRDKWVNSFPSVAASTATTEP